MHTQPLTVLNLSQANAKRKERASQRARRVPGSIEPDWAFGPEPSVFSLGSGWSDGPKAQVESTRLWVFGNGTQA